MGAALATYLSRQMSDGVTAIASLYMSQSRAKSLESNDSPRPAGKVVHDARGTAIWDLGSGTGALAMGTRTGVLRMLNEPTLAIEGEREPCADWGGDPYNRGVAPR